MGRPAIIEQLVPRFVDVELEERLPRVLFGFG
jgi:hypothetical protein